MTYLGICPGQVTFHLAVLVVAEVAGPAGPGCRLLINLSFTGSALPQYLRRGTLALRD